MNELPVYPIESGPQLSHQDALLVMDEHLNELMTRVIGALLAPIYDADEAVKRELANTKRQVGVNLRHVMAPVDRALDGMLDRMDYYLAARGDDLDSQLAEATAEELLRTPRQATLQEDGEYPPGDKGPTPVLVEPPPPLTPFVAGPVVTVGGELGRQTLVGGSGPDLPPLGKGDIPAEPICPPQQIVCPPPNVNVDCHPAQVHITLQGGQQTTIGPTTITQHSTTSISLSQLISSVSVLAPVEVVNVLNQWLLQQGDITVTVPVTVQVGDITVPAKTKEPETEPPQLFGPGAGSSTIPILGKAPT